ncbi:MAG: malonyl-ACP O-methyltransferase BioC [Proteobacteria bacterium]|nr:malonyl-ACP O-methyltransferase BioC [Pseudomonadota bacterium]
MSLDSLDSHALRRAFDRAAASYDEYAVLQREVADRLLERLTYIKCEPRTILDLGTGTGYCSRALAKRYKKAHIVGVDLATAMLQQAGDQKGWFSREHYCAADAERLPLADNSVDMVFSSLTFQWCDLAAVFAECRRVLRPGGLLMFTSFGPTTLHELRGAWAEVDVSVHVHDYQDLRVVGDALVDSRMAQPVIDTETLTLTYADVAAVLHDLKMIGATNAAHDRQRGLLGRQRYARFVQAYEAFKLEDGRYPASYEIVYGHAWCPDAAEADNVAPIELAGIPINTMDQNK